MSKPPNYGRLKVTRRVNVDGSPKGERLYLVLPNGDHITIDVVATGPFTADLVITAPRTLPIIRSEIIQKDTRDEEERSYHRDNGVCGSRDPYEFIEERHES